MIIDIERFFAAEPAAVAGTGKAARSPGSRHAAQLRRGSPPALSLRTYVGGSGAAQHVCRGVGSRSLPERSGGPRLCGNLRDPPPQGPLLPARLVLSGIPAHVPPAHRRIRAGPRAYSCGQRVRRLRTGRGQQRKTGIDAVFGPRRRARRARAPRGGRAKPEPAADTTPPSPRT